MKTTLMTAVLLAASVAVAQAPNPLGAPTAYPAQNDTPGSRTDAKSLSQSTIQGCVQGSNGRYAVTDVNSGTIYLLAGSDFLLQPQVGHQVSLTGTATYIEPSNKKGQPGYVSPNEPDRAGEAGTRAGAKVQNFEVQDVQKIADTCQGGAISAQNAVAASQAALGGVSTGESGTEPHIGYNAGGGNQLQGCLSGHAGNYMLSQPNLNRTYRVQGNEGQLRQNVGRQVQLTGHLQPGEAPVFQADNVQRLAESCGISTPPGPTQAVGGKEGNEGTETPVTTTGSVGATTPGVNTQAGAAQQPGDNAQVGAGGVPQPQNQTEKQGAPKPAEQIGEDRASSERIAGNVHETEVGGYQSGNYGVNGKQPSGQAENNAPGSAKKTGQAMKGQMANDGFKPASGSATQAQSAQRTTMTGCLNGTKNGQEFTLAANDGRQIRLDAPREDLKDHINHLVQIVGHQENGQEATKAVARKKGENRFYVDGVNDLAPTCGK